MKWKVLCMQQTIWIIFIKILFPGRTYRTSKWWQCLASGIKWFPDMDTRPLYLQPEKYQHQVPKYREGIKVTTKYQSVNIRYVRNFLSLFLFKDNTFFRLLIPFKDIKLFQMITDQIKLQRSVEEDLTPEPQTKWFSSWPFVQPGSRNWSDCTFFVVFSSFYSKLALDIQTLCDFRWFAFQTLTTSRSTGTRAMWM